MTLQFLPPATILSLCSHFSTTSQKSFSLLFLTPPFPFSPHLLQSGFNPIILLKWFLSVLSEIFTLPNPQSSFGSRILDLSVVCGTGDHTFLLDPPSALASTACSLHSLSAHWPLLPPFLLAPLSFPRPPKAQVIILLSYRATLIHPMLLNIIYMWMMLNFVSSLVIPPGALILYLSTQHVHLDVSQT